MTDIDPDGARRRVLRLGLAGAASLIAAPGFAARPHGEARTISFHHLHTGEDLRVPYWADGRYQPEALAQLDRLLRDFRTGEEHAIDPRLFDLLHALRGKLESAEPIHVISGYRSPRTNAMLRKAGGRVAVHSLHMQGMAIDIRLPGRRTRDIYRAARALAAGGVGYYPKSRFVHVDTGRVRFW